MKPLFILSVLALSMLLIFDSCKKEEEINVFKFKASGESFDFSADISTGKNLFEDQLIQAKNGDNQLTILMKKFEAKKFTEEDYVESDDFASNNYDILYTEDQKTFSYSPDYDGGYFNIDITFLNNIPGGKIKGKFSGKLFYRAFLSDSVEIREITNGEFITLID